MLKIIIHRGTHQIGGCATEFQCNKTRVLIDLGANLPGGNDKAVLSDKKLLDRVFGKNRNQKNRKKCKHFDAILFSHYHGDHYGLYKEVPEGIPMYIGKSAKEILGIVVGYSDKNAENKGAPVIERMQEYVPNEYVIDNEDMKILPIRADHSALDAYMFLIEAEGKSILFTGDFREHGIAGDDGEFERAIDRIGKVDILITEGTMLSREDKENEVLAKSEEELGARAGKIFSSKPYNFVVVSSTNLDSVMEFYHNTPEDKRFICDAYQGKVMAVAVKNNHKQYGKYQGKAEGKSWSKHIDLLGYTAKENKMLINGIAAQVKTEGGNPIFADNIGEDFDKLDKGFVMLIRPNRFPENGNKPYEKVLAHYKELCPDKVNIVYSMWSGYLKGKNRDEDLLRLVGDTNELIHLHTSGHAYVKTIAKLMDKVSPDMIIPMHTEMADSFTDIKDFEAHKNKVRVLHDGECLTVDHGNIVEPKYEFKRKTDYSEGLKDDIRKILDTYNDILIMPNRSGFKGYYKGIVLLENISERCFNIVDRNPEGDSDIAQNNSLSNDLCDAQNNALSDEVNANFGKDLKALLRRREENITRFYAEDFHEKIEKLYAERMCNDRERRSSQIIALDNMSYKYDRYSVCGWETTIPLHDVYDIGKQGAPEIDMVLVNPAEKTIMLVEYKCLGTSMLEGAQNLLNHYHDYKAVLRAKAFEHIKTEMLKAYKLMYEIKNPEETFIYEEIDWKTKIGFLFVDMVEVDGRVSEITEEDYQAVINREDFSEVMEDAEIMYIRARRVSNTENYKDGNPMADESDFNSEKSVTDDVDFSSWRPIRGSQLAITCKGNNE